jgi:hypothetical protein
LTDELGAARPREPRRRYGKKLRLVSLKDLDGRSIAAKEAEAFRAAVVSDLGGEEHLSAVEQQLATNVAWGAARLNDMNARWAMGQDVAPTEIATVENAFNRTAQLLGTKRRSRDITPKLTDFLVEGGE